MSEEELENEVFLDDEDEEEEEAVTDTSEDIVDDGTDIASTDSGTDIASTDDGSTADTGGASGTAAGS